MAPKDPESPSRQASPGLIEFYAFRVILYLWVGLGLMTAIRGEASETEVITASIAFAALAITSQGRPRAA